MSKIASNNFQKGRCACSIEKVIQATLVKVIRNLDVQKEFSIYFFRHDIEYAIEKGDALYKLQNTDQLLSCTCLPGIVQVEYHQFSVNFLEENYGFWEDSHK